MTTTTIEQIQQGTATDLLTTELNSLATNTFATLGAAVNNVQATSNFNGYPFGEFQLTLAAYTGTPSAGAALYVWWLRSIDGGSNYETANTSIARAPDLIIPISPIASGPQICYPPSGDWRLPAGLFKPYAKSVGVGLTLASSGNKLTVLPRSLQSV